MDGKKQFDNEIVRDCVTMERVERGLSDYRARRSSGVDCPDLRPPQLRNEIESLRVQRLSVARQFVERLRH